VFFALYSALDSSVELRQVSFLWCTDLARPDLVGPQINLPFFGPTGLHPLVIAMTLLMVLQQKMTPSNMDPAQQKVMLLMPVIMLFMLYNLPSGLTLYWTVSQVFSILQMKYGQIIAEREEAKAAAAPPAK
jgi:YidC/Oxa1 family membrane protein insertase